MGGVGRDEMQDTRNEMKRNSPPGQRHRLDGRGSGLGVTSRLGKVVSQARAGMRSPKEKPRGVRCQGRGKGGKDGSFPI